jgi:hypothetical protein
MSSARKQGWVPQSTGDTQHNVRDAALRGAALAFSKSPAKPKPLVNTYTGGDNGALLAATKVGTRSPASLRSNHTGGSVGVSRPNLSKSNSSNSLSVPDDHDHRVPSPSNIAARLAAARHSPLRPTTPQARVAPIMSEQQANERDVMPPSGSVGNVLSRLEPKKPSQQPRKRRDSFGSSHSAAGAVRRPESRHMPTDDTPIPPTHSLVTMFEQARPVTPTNQPTEPLHVTQHSPPPVRSPKPQRAFRLPSEPQDDAPLQRTRTRTPPPVKPKPNHTIQLSPPQNTDGPGEQAYLNTPKRDPLKSPATKQKPVQLATLNTSSSQPPKLPSQRGSHQTRPKSEDVSQPAQPAQIQRRRPSTSHSLKAPSTPSSFKSAKEEQEEEARIKPSLPPPRRSTVRKTDHMPTANRLQPSVPILIKPRTQSQHPVSLPPMQRLSPPQRPTSTTGTPSPSVYHNNYQRESVKQITQHMTGESLSSAIMGAALAASSRNVSPAPRPMSVEPLFPARKQHHHVFHRSPSPPKASPPKSTGKMRTTMRKDPSSSDDEDKVDKYKKKGTRIMGIKGRKHPNKHHEGTRKRWRDQITDRERKRYEGVWAANKGLHIPTSTRTGPEDDPLLDVLSFLVKEIWTRSRLPTHVLEEVWDLVDCRGIGRLSRYEFVVGLWLIDQRLKGRKLPIKVSDSVWQSARGVQIKVKIRD